MRGGLLTLTPLPRLLLLLMTLAAVPACGVQLRESSPSTELFKEIALSGERVPGRELTVTVTVSQGYPVPVRVACLYEKERQLSKEEKELSFAERATLIGETVLPPASAGRPGDAGTTRRLSFTFSVPEAGSYDLACMTPAAADNRLVLSFKVDAADG